jgi:hypothetical protein
MTTLLSTLSDDELDREARRVAQVERDSTVELLRLLIEVERRGLHLALGHSSLFVYCTRILRMSEQSAYRRITAARAAKRFPRMLDLLADGSLTLSSVGLLVPQLTEETADSLVDAARFKSTRGVERLIATAFPQPDVPMLIRACPARAETEPAAGLLAPAGNSGGAEHADDRTLTRCPSAGRRSVEAARGGVPISARRYFLNSPSPRTRTTSSTACALCGIPLTAIGCPEPR